MRYQQNTSQSCELLRMAIPLMAKHEAPCHPITYTIWYEYLAGFNPGLTAAIDKHTSGHGRVDDATVARLYREHVLDDWSRRALGIQDEMGSVLDRFDASTHQLEDESLAFDSDWDALASLLDSPGDQARLSELRRATLEAGARVRARSVSLRDELEASHRETQELRTRMNDLQAQVITDPLTGTYNRRGLQARWLDITAETIRVTVARAELRNKRTGANAGQVTISSGVTCLRAGEALEALIERADGAMYRAKASGRNQVIAA